MVRINMIPGVRAMIRNSALGHDLVVGLGIGATIIAVWCGIILFMVGR